MFKKLTCLTIFKPTKTGVKLGIEVSQNQFALPTIQQIPCHLLANGKAIRLCN